MVKIKYSDTCKKKLIWCSVRKKYFTYQPEEEVRQKFIEFLYTKKSYPKTLMKVEKLVHYPNMLKRSDILVFDRNGTPKMLVECKAPIIKIKQQTFQQIAQYNKQLKVPYLVVTNGTKHYCVKINFSTKEISFLNDIPAYKVIL